MQLPPECRKDGHYSVHAEIFKKCRVAPNAFREGMPVLVKSCGSHFDEAPFSPAALEELARAQNQLVGNCFILLEFIRLGKTSCKRLARVLMQIDISSASWS